MAAIVTDHGGFASCSLSTKRVGRPELRLLALDPTKSDFTVLGGQMARSSVGVLALRVKCDGFEGLFERISLTVNTASGSAFCPTVVGADWSSSASELALTSEPRRLPSAATNFCARPGELSLVEV